MRKALLALLLGGMILGCSEWEAADTTVAAAADGITYGSLDSTHQAVVSYRANGALCSATIVHKSGTTGYALTAAHCIGADPGVIRQGDNSANGQYDVQYTVVDTETHPDWSGEGLYDFAMLRFSSATAATPVIAPMSAGEDNLHAGSMVDLVGYGMTESGSTTWRHHLVRPITYETAMRLVFDQSGTNGGLCSGDSGGPVLADVSGSERVAGVIAFTSGSCTDQGTAVRVSAVYDTFLMPFINNTPYGQQTCTQCYDAALFGACKDTLEACLYDNDCSAYVDCINGCGSSTCRLQCALDYIDALPLYDAIDDCVCSTGCAAECGSEDFCNPAAGCGFTSSNAGCQTCLEDNCCTEAAACAADYPICASCMSSIPHASCPTTESAAFQGCLQQHCPIACNTGLGGTGGTGGAGAEGGAGVGGVGGAVVGGSAPGGTGGAGASQQTSEPFTVEQGGCGCAVVGERSRRRALTWLIALTAVFAAARRRHGRRSLR
ncbi:MAG: hypothetical protein JRI23_24090 [Deltaproteobacteria bacterium]|jgi:hypothetical protein|nr:hypothetical protein [Deltaproteobacteria bacterium]MBW2535078.1 hypothetical protein [Deltaproteobacteria bacterium]